MAQIDRKNIARQIQKLSREITTIFSSLIQDSESLKKLDEMLYHWSLLADYYENSVYNRKDDSADGVDVEIDISMVHNYVYWTDLLQTLMTEASQKGLRSEAEMFDENLNTLENEMQRILKVNADMNDLPFSS